jgi:hypothetical protein
MLIRDTIQESSSAVMGRPKGFISESFEYSLVKTGDVHVIARSPVVANRSTRRVMMF